MVAEVGIEFVGTSTQGESWKWGNLLIGKGKALVKLERIFVGRAKPPYLYKDGNDGWPDGIDIAIMTKPLKKLSTLYPMRTHGPLTPFPLQTTA